MKSSFQLTNDYRLMGHLSKLFKAEVDGRKGIHALLEEIDNVYPDLPLNFRDVILVYETFPVFGEFMFPKPKSHLWQLIETVDAAMLLTDSMVQGKEGLFICRPLDSNNPESDVANVIIKQTSPNICLNTYKGKQALLYPLISL